jgi:transcriptional regulator with XRE-family HTH domain
LPEVGSMLRALGRLIASERRAKGWSLSELARRSQVGKATISRWENGESQPAIPVLDAVLKTLEVPVERYEQAYALIGAPRGVRALRATEDRLRGEFTELGIGTLTPGDLIRAMRLRSGLKSYQLAERLGVSRAAISLWERGERKPDVELLDRIAEALGATPCERDILEQNNVLVGSVRGSLDYSSILQRLEANARIKSGWARS